MLDPPLLIDKLLYCVHLGLSTRVSCTEASIGKARCVKRAVIESWHRDGVRWRGGGERARRKGRLGTRALMCIIRFCAPRTVCVRAAKVWITLIIKRDHIEVMHEQFFISAFYWRALAGSTGALTRSAREFIALCCVIKLNSPLPAAITAIRSLRHRADARANMLAHRLFVFPPIFIN